MITITIDTDRSGMDTARTIWDGKVFRAHSRHGAIHALCRDLRDAGVPDQPWELPRRIKGGSIYWMADRTVSEASGRAKTVLVPADGAFSGAVRSPIALEPPAGVDVPPRAQDAPRSEAMGAVLHSREPAAVLEAAQPKEPT